MSFLTIVQGQWELWLCHFKRNSIAFISHSHRLKAIDQTIVFVRGEFGEAKRRGIWRNCECYVWWKHPFVLPWRRDEASRRNVNKWKKGGKKHELKLGDKWIRWIFLFVPLPTDDITHREKGWRLGATSSIHTCKRRIYSVTFRGVAYSPRILKHNSDNLPFLHSCTRISSAQFHWKIARLGLSRQMGETEYPPERFE